MRNLIWAAICLLSSSFLLAQNDLSSMVLKDSWQALNTNPALQPDGILVNLPGVYNNLWLTNITFNDLVRTDGDATIIDIDQAIDLMGEQNILRENIDIETVGFGIKVGALGLHLGHRMRFNALVDYPKTLAQLIWQGNAQFIGETVAFGPSFDLLGYHELALGANYKIADKVTIGGRVKLLSGAASLNTERNDLRLTTSDDVYQLELDADLLVNSSGSINYDGLRDIELDFNSGNFSTSELLGQNTGLAFDLGISVDLGKLQLSASAIDLGAEIEWDENTTNYTLDGKYEFEGLDIAQQLFDDEESFGAIVDSLYETYEPVETRNSYQTTIGSKLYFSAQYAVSDDISVGLIAFNEDYRDLNTAAVAVTGSMPLGSFARVGALYGWRNERADNLGLNATLALGPVRVLLATDNVISAFRPKEANLANFRLGFNLAFGQ